MIYYYIIKLTINYLIMKKIFLIITTFIFTGFITSCDKDTYYDDDVIIINSFNNYNDSTKTNNNNNQTNKTNSATISFGVSDVTPGN